MTVGEKTTRRSSPSFQVTMCGKRKRDMGQSGYATNYDFLVDGTHVRVFRMNQLIKDFEFSTEDKDTKDNESPLYVFLESIGRSRVDAHMVCVEVEAGRSVQSVHGLRCVLGGCR